MQSLTSVHSYQSIVIREFGTMRLSGCHSEARSDEESALACARSRSSHLKSRAARALLLLSPHQRFVPCYLITMDYGLIAGFNALLLSPACRSCSASATSRPREAPSP